VWLTRGTKSAASASSAATPEKKKPEPPPAPKSTPLTSWRPLGIGTEEPGVGETEDDRT
jgi:hypothetical protein